MHLSPKEKPSYPQIKYNPFLVLWNASMSCVAACAMYNIDYAGFDWVTNLTKLGTMIFPKKVLATVSKTFFNHRGFAVYRCRS